MTNETGSSRNPGFEQSVNEIVRVDGRYQLCYDLEATLADRVRAFVAERDVAGDFTEMTRRGVAIAKQLDGKRHITAHYPDPSETRVITWDLLQQADVPTVRIIVTVDPGANAILERLAVKYPSATFSSLVNAGLRTYLELVVLHEENYFMTWVNQEGETSDLMPHGL